MAKNYRPTLALCIALHGKVLVVFQSVLSGVAKCNELPSPPLVSSGYW